MTRFRPSALLRARDGAVIVEFALLAPVILVLMIGVFHVAVYVQNYNAVRSVVSDAGRHVMVQYQKDNTLAESEIHSVMLSIATSSPYLLDTDRLEIDVDREATSRVSGTIEFDIDVVYDMQDWLPFVDLPTLQLSYSRPVFVVQPAAPTS